MVFTVIYNDVNEQHNFWYFYSATTVLYAEISTVLFRHTVSSTRHHPQSLITLQHTLGQIVSCQGGSTSEEAALADSLQISTDFTPKCTFFSSSSRMVGELTSDGVEGFSS